MKSKYPDIRRYLEHPFRIPTLEDGITYERKQDDQEDGPARRLQVRIGAGGEASIGIDGTEMINFHGYAGGGDSLRTHAALMVLAEAIRLDNLEHAQAKQAASSASAPPLASLAFALAR